MTSLLFCSCGAGIFPGDKTERLIKRLKGLSVKLYEVRDLCAIALNDKKLLADIFNEEGRKVIIACYPRAVSNILLQNGIKAGNYDLINFREADEEQVMDRLTGEMGISRGEAAYLTIATTLKVPAWYPVIDRSLCTLCGQCYEFCLFGVYRFNKESLTVANPLSCKNKCPACGRNCPHSAIIFPGVPENSVLSGKEPDKAPVRQASRQGFSVMYYEGLQHGKQSPAGLPKENDSIFDALQSRKSGRRSILKEGLAGQAIEKRKIALRDLHGKRKEKD